MTIKNNKMIAYLVARARKIIMFISVLTIGLHCEFSETEFQCEQTVAHLYQCCKTQFESMCETSTGCYQADVGITAEMGRCLSNKSCAEIEAAGFCALPASDRVLRCAAERWTHYGMSPPSVAACQAVASLCGPLPAGALADMVSPRPVSDLAKSDSAVSDGSGSDGGGSDGAVPSG